MSEVNSAALLERDINMGDVLVIDLPGGGQGNISLHDRLESGEFGMELVEDITDEIISGKYSIETSVRWIRKCGDGRDSEDPIDGTQLFGGTAGLIKSLALGGVIEPSQTAAQDIAKEVSSRRMAGKLSGDHRAPAHGPGCGCGECDGADAAARLLNTARNTIASFTEDIIQGIDLGARFGFSDEQYSTAFGRVADRYTELQTKGYFTDGKAMVDAIDQAEPDEHNVELLRGDHGEIMWVINLRKGTRFDREAFVSDYADKNIQVFWEDQWAAEEEILDYAADERELQTTLIADVVRRVATAANLTKADLRLVILK